ncbi:hypothetical protein M407DRAFT_7551 [Tulasnella calospora MUT 4182]|uniref:Uncharacterized protein n=1 Tax=Tulasnella calospora MUT 4182 TaxID=1051891 RepID=A0A0C3QJ12_9AGAM|nr:hypothetical protein M407DRAFT_7551 [Tulasnella calospora MUT 4182]
MSASDRREPPRYFTQRTARHSICDEQLHSLKRQQRFFNTGMSSTTASGTRLNSAEPSDIEFLDSFFTDLSPILMGQMVNPELRGLHSAGCILSEALGYLDVHEEPPTSEQLELDSDPKDGTWVKDWDVQELLEWTLLEARAACLLEESHELQRLIERLERR